ncbi:MAG: trypsin-like peptidase domain-containing protein [Candidatus Blackburnbacteria bacterium]|nr:trypsin-like peptidase domain-containing protein [Candidatus Blackburnbacteria bacterium]
MRIRRFLLGVAVGIVVLVSILGGALADRLFGLRPLDYLFPQAKKGIFETVIKREVLQEESIVVDVAERVSPTVVTISAVSPKRKILEFSPFGGFGFREQGGEQDLATGFIVSSDGLILTNKHVISVPNVKYKVITKDDKEYEIKKIYRDPANDIALLKIDPPAGGQGLATVELGNSDNLKVGQFVIAIGTALGEFRHTVTTGVISGLGRGITAGSPFEGYVERLDNVIQTDAAINPGNSGGPLLNSSGQVIGVNVAVAAEAQNIGFAIPINIIKQSIEQFRQTGEFSRPFLGVRYLMVSKETAIANEVPQGAYVQEVVSGSPAGLAGIKEGDVITKIGGEAVREEGGGLATIINKYKVGDRIEIEVWREGETLKLSASLTQAEE